MKRLTAPGGIRAVAATGDREGLRALRDSLHALSACRSTTHDLRQKPGPERGRWHDMAELSNPKISDGK